jgi:hypothetical protein
MARGCARCNMLDSVGVDGQTFYAGDLQYDIAKARAIIEAVPREPIEVPPGEAYEAVLKTDISLKHSRHVDIKFPSIAVRKNRKYLIIDGNHRAFARLCRRLPVKAYLLTPREMRAILNRK